ncbi:hypothetical protein N8586_00340 [Verrucomicrobiales bacterium]|nr:hypothetical protein [Verrucomicrobiales bacterium]MDB2327141.1 hypothetical protein [bacterium]MDF1789138.1 hypothetical protein [Verrucomicrobiales bacterium]
MNHPDVADVERGKAHMMRHKQAWPGVQKLEEFLALHHAGETKTLGEVFDAHWKEKGSKRRDEYGKDIRNFTEKVRGVLGDNIPLPEITGDMLSDAIDEAWQNVMNNQFNKVRRTLRPIWTFAKQRGWAGVNIFDRIPTRE